VHALLASLAQPHLHLPEVELSELSGHALKAHHQPRRHRLADRRVQPVERARPELDPFLPQQPQRLQRRRLRVLGQQRRQPFPYSLRDSRATYPARSPTRSLVGALDRILPHDPLHRPR